MTLIDLIGKYRDVVTTMIDSGGELTPEVERLMQEIDSELPKKIDSYAVIDERLDAEIKYLKNIETQIKGKRQQLENIKKNCNDRIKMAILAMEKKTVEGEYYKYSLARSKPKIIIDEGMVPKEYKKEIVVIEVDKKMIEEDLKTGVMVAGAKLEDSYSLRKYFTPNKKEIEGSAK